MRQLCCGNAFAEGLLTAPALARTGVYAHRAYVARAFVHRMMSLGILSVRCASADKVSAPHASLHLTCPLRACAAQLGSLIAFAWLVALKPKKKTD